MYPDLKGFMNIALLILVVVLTGTLGYVILIEKSAPLITQPTAISDINPASQALIEYFNLLNEKQYDGAVKYHGSGYEYLQNWNPTIDGNDQIALIKNGCEKDGLQCLKIKNILNQQQISSTEFKFVAQFANNDGTLFKQGPCCGSTEEEMPTKTNFEYIVKKVNNEFLVITQPVYIP